MYLLKSPSWSRRVKIAFEWTWELLFPRDLAYPRIARTERIARAHYRPGDVIFVEGEPAVNFYVIEQGEVEAIRRDLTGQPNLWRCLDRESFSARSRSSTALCASAASVARTEVEVLVMSKLRWLVEQSHVDLSGS